MSGFTGTGRLLRLALRRDRVQLPVWLVGLALVVWASAASVAGLYDTQQARLNYATVTAGSAVARAFNGLTSGPDLGAIAVVESYVITAILAALMSIFAVVRHTRQNEETGRAELLASGVVGRHASLAAAVVLTTLANLGLAGLVALVLIATGLGPAGSVLAGAAVASAGLCFTGVAAMTSQVAESTRAAIGLGSTVLGVAFLLRAAGDALGTVSADGMSVVSRWPSWLSPLGWGQQTRPFADNAWWLLGLPVAFLAAAGAAALFLNARRDFGAGLVPVRPGPATAHPRLLSPLGLAWRLQRGVLLGWVVGVIVLALTLGAVGDAVNDLAGQNEAMVEALRQLGGGGGLVDTYFGSMLSLFAIAIAAYTVQALLRLRAEEVGGQLEPVLATAASRSRWLASHAAWAALGSALLLVLGGATTGLGYGWVAGDPAGEAVRLAGAALVWLPATLALGGFVVAAFGLLPRWSGGLAWAALTACLLMGQIGALLELPQAVLNVSPFTHVPAVPAADLAAIPLVVMVLAAVALAGAGLLLFHRRDLTTA